MDDVVNRFARELADAIAVAVAENPQVEACREKARAAGFEMKVTLDAARLLRPSGSWAWRRIEGKGLSVLRLAKASFTFAGGADYITWKINRHAGTNIELKPWQRRWPLLAAISLLPRLLKSGAVR